jgi:hypothetical protein
LLLLGLGLTSSALAATPSHPLETAIVDPDVFFGPDGSVGLAHAVAAGAGAIKIPLFWDGVAPAQKPAHFTASDPASSAYNWSQIDAQIRLVRAHGLEPLVYISGAPTWAQSNIGGTMRTDPAAYRAFALAAVRRYSGGFDGLPRVRYWQAWNEPNKVPGPQFKPTVAAWYRTIVNAFAASVHTVPGDIVTAGGLAPFGISTAVAPLTFMESLLCVKLDPKPHATCHLPVHFDIWSTDPYTAGGPTHKATHRGDVSVAELPQMKAVLDAGVRFGNVVSPHPVRFWVTEFSWDSNPPDPGGVPAALEGRWVAQALYDMWSSGVSLVTWFTIRDQPVATSAYQSGLYYRGATIAQDRPKPAFTAFRFPFVAFPAGKKTISVWGRTPRGKPGTVIVQQRGPHGWGRLSTLRANGSGIFAAKLTSSGRGPLRAQFQGDGSTSLPFSLVSPPDRPFQPFGAPVRGVVGGAPPGSSAADQYVEREPTAGGGPASASRTASRGSAPASALAAVGDAVGTGGERAVAFGGALLALTVLLSVAAHRTGRRA